MRSRLRAAPSGARFCCSSSRLQLFSFHQRGGMSPIASLLPVFGRPVAATAAPIASCARTPLASAAWDFFAPLLTLLLRRYSEQPLAAVVSAKAPVILRSAFFPSLARHFGPRSTPVPFSCARSARGPEIYPGQRRCAQ